MIVLVTQRRREDMAQVEKYHLWYSYISIVIDLTPQQGSIPGMHEYCSLY